MLLTTPSPPSPGDQVRGDRVEGLVLRAALLHVPPIRAGHHRRRSLLRLLHEAGRLCHPQVLHQHQPDPVRGGVDALGAAEGSAGSAQLWPAPVSGCQPVHHVPHMERHGQPARYVPVFHGCLFLEY